MTARQAKKVMRKCYWGRHAVRVGSFLRAYAKRRRLERRSKRQAPRGRWGRWDAFLPEDQATDGPPF